ncbi:MAG: metallophosphoesterase family protein [Acidobacteriota bacterium]
MPRVVAGIISDTHGRFDPRVIPHFRGVHQILHAGDVGGLKVLHELQQLAPVVAVKGNVDEGAAFASLEAEQIVEVGPARVFVTHILGDPHRLRPGWAQKLNAIGPDVVVFGHSHVPCLAEVDGILFFNPGSAGPRRFKLKQTIGLLFVEEEGDIRGEIVSL